MLTPAWTPLRPHPLQSQLWRSSSRFIAVAAGRGSGKTELARRRIVRELAMVKDYPDPLYFYAMPTRDQAKRVAWEKIKALIPKEWLLGDPRETDMSIRTIFGSTLYVVGMDKPQRIEGNQWDAGIIDESSDHKPGSFARSILPALTHRKAWSWRIGVPKRFGIGALDFKEYFHSPDVEAYTWPSSDILTPAELKWFRDNMSAADFDEQFNANWLSSSGLIFSEFDEFNHVVKCGYDPSKPIVVGSDFNVNPMAWVLGQVYYDSGNVRRLHIFSEVWLRNTTTQRTLNHIAPAFAEHRAGWEFIGDATARARKTSAAITDYLQICNDDRFANKTVSYPKANPSRADRFATCNALFSKGRFSVDPSCVNLIRDLKNRSYVEGTRDVNDIGDLGHISDALGYIIYSKFPIIYEAQKRISGGVYAV